MPQRDRADQGDAFWRLELRCEGMRATSSHSKEVALEYRSRLVTGSVREVL